MDTDRRAVPQAGARRARGRRATLLRYALGLAAVGAVVYFFVRERELFVGFGAAISHLNWYWVVVAFAVELASVPPLAEAQRMLLRAGGVEADRFQVNLVTLASNAISLSVPAGVAIAEGYSFTRYRRLGADTAVAAWSELAAGAIAFCALAGLALVGALIAGGEAEPILLSLLAVVFAGSAGAAILFRHPLFMVRAVAWMQTHLGPAGRLVDRLASGFCAAARSLTHVRPSMGLWTAAWGLSALNWFLDAVCLALLFEAVHIPIPWGAVLLAFAGSKVVTSVGITPGGLGVVEGGLVATFVAYGVSGAGAGAAVLVYRALTLIGLVGIGWLGVALLAVEDRRRAERSQRPRLPAGPAKAGQQRRDSL
jgi:putative heme transporter